MSFQANDEIRINGLNISNLIYGENSIMIFTQNVVEMIDCHFYNYSIESRNGLIYVENEAEFTIINSTFISGYQTSLGAISLTYENTFTMINCTFENIFNDYNGAALCIESDNFLYLFSSSFIGCSSGNGGAIRLSL